MSRAARDRSQYAWIELRDRSLHNGDATAAMRSVGLKTRSGDQFGAGVHFTRLELLMREETFTIVAEKLHTLLHA